MAVDSGMYLALKYEPSSEPLHISHDPRKQAMEEQKMILSDIMDQEHNRQEMAFSRMKLQVRIHFIIVMIWWTGLAPWEFEFPFPGSLIYTFLEWTRSTTARRWPSRA